MKLSYRDRIVILIAIIVVILGLGIFLLIKPAWQKLNKSMEEFETLNTEWDAKLLEFARRAIELGTGVAVEMKVRERRRP